MNEDEYCTICWTSELGSEPCIKLGCGHVFHVNCIKSILENKWTSFRITFAFLNCPSCKQEMDVSHCPALKKSFDKVMQIKSKVIELAMKRAEYEGIFKDKRL